MYLSELKLWNFRKYGINGDTFETADPGIDIHFHQGVNVLIGENDSGKTAIIDAIRYALRTQSGEYIQYDEKDFYQDNNGRVDEFKIECIFDGLNAQDAGLFWEWLITTEGMPQRYLLEVRLYAKRKDNVIIPTFSAGFDGASEQMDNEARNLLRVVYLKPLRDALTDMTHGYKSRLAQILGAHNLFSSKKDENGKEKKHIIETDYSKLKTKIDDYFKSGQPGEKISESINNFLTNHFFIEGDHRKAEINLTGGELSEILRQLDLVLGGNKSGLGTLNLLCIAAEMLLFSNQTRGLKLALVEELEAHLHPQYQLRLIDYISNNTLDEQFILTTHSITLASKIKLNNLIILKDNEVYPMSEDYTEMTSSDYSFLERFLDATKANLFFAQGLIMVEGDAENLLIPAIAEAIGRPLHKYGVSIVNIGSTAYKRYLSIFSRKDGRVNMPISVISDLDVRSLEYYNDTKAKRPLPSVWMMDDIKKELISITSEVDYEAFPEIIESKAELERMIRCHWTNNFPKTIGKTIDKLKTVLRDDNSRKVTEEILLKQRKKKTQILHDLIDKEKTKIFLPKLWTLEYDIANSQIYRLLDTAIKAAKLEKQNPENIIDDNVLNEIWKNVMIEYPKEHVLTLQDSYNIFRPLNDKDVSKAITAQYLASMIQKQIPPTSIDSDIMCIVKETLTTDSKLKYLIDAINHVTNR